MSECVESEMSYTQGDITVIGNKATLKNNYYT